MEYLSLEGRAESERVVERSRFLAYAAHTAGEERARAFLNEVRALHPLSTHVCWAYVSDRLGNELRFSDDGEPQGTAGMPILGVIRAQKLFETTVAVVRYFGGVKLGAGGLVRAYSSAASDVLAAADRRCYAECSELQISVGYPQTDALQRFLSARGVRVLSQEYGTDVRLTVAVRAGERDAFSSSLTDALNGRVTIAEKTTYFFPFPLEKDA